MSDISRERAPRTRCYRDPSARWPHFPEIRFFERKSWKKNLQELFFLFCCCAQQVRSPAKCPSEAMEEEEEAGGGGSSKQQQQPQQHQPQQRGAVQADAPAREWRPPLADKRSAGGMAGVELEVSLRGHCVKQGTTFNNTLADDSIRSGLSIMWNVDTHCRCHGYHQEPLDTGGF